MILSNCSKFYMLTHFPALVTGIYFLSSIAEWISYVKEILPSNNIKSLVLVIMDVLGHLEHP